MHYKSLVGDNKSRSCLSGIMIISLIFQLMTVHYSGDVSKSMFNRLYKLCKKVKGTSNAELMANIMLFTWVREEK